MAPEDLLNSVDDSRREFIRKIIAGTTFAVPLMASFSMEGLSVDPAEALTSDSNATCAETGPGSLCCELAEEISVVIGLVICLTGVVGLSIGVSPNIKAQLFTPPARALIKMSSAIRMGDSCQTDPAKEHFRQARGYMVSYLSLLAALCGHTSDVFLALNEGAPLFFAALDDLIAGDCENGMTALQNLAPLQQQLQSQYGLPQ